MNKARIIQTVAEETEGRVVVVSPSERDSRLMAKSCDELSDVHFSTISHADRIRGLRANVVVFDGYQRMPQELIEVIVHGFAALTKTPIEGQSPKESPKPTAVIYLT